MLALTIFNKDLFFDKKKGYSSLIYCFVLIAVFFMATCFKYNIPAKAKKPIAITWLLTSAVLNVEMSRMALNSNYTAKTSIYYINLLFYVLLIAICFAVSNRIKISVIITSTVSYIFLSGTEIVTVLRGTPIMPSDFFSISTALNVAGGYQFSLTKGIISITIYFMTILAVNHIIEWQAPKENKKSWVLRTGSLTTVVAMLFVISFVDKNACDQIGMFHQDKINKKYGIAYTLYMNLCRLKISEPANYNAEEVSDVFNLFETEEASATEKEYPNIIAIMNESFSDPRVIGDFETNESFMPFLDSLSNDDPNVIKGDLLVSVFGGNTCNSEFEFLTGLSMQYFPDGSIPYMQYIKSDVDTICTDLAQYGYSTTAIHPFWASSWKRETVYPLLGFEDFISGEDFATGDVDKSIEDDWNERAFGDDLEYIRSFLSDRQSYNKIEELYENKDENQPMFLFNITMQNHGGYNRAYGDFPETTHFNNGWYFSQAKRYLNLIRESDKAFEELTEYFANVDEPTIILMFGDHQPNIETKFYEKLYGKSLDDLTLEEEQKQYTVPYVIWANYDISEHEGSEYISANYLSNLLLEVAEIPTNPKRDIIKKTQEEYPLMNSKGIMTKDGEWIQRSEIIEDDILLMYHQMEYYMLFD